MKRGWIGWSGAALALALVSPARASVPVSDLWLSEIPALQDSAAPPAMAPDEPVRFRERNLSGPRLGMTMIIGNDETMNALRNRDMGPLMSQFGWHFERQIVPLGGGPQFIIESVPMVGGVEYGEFIPSITLAMGVRWPSGVEFGMGPSLSATPTSGSRTALVIAAGRSFDYGGVSLPVNVALSTNPKGQRLSLILGYAIRQTH